MKKVFLGTDHAGYEQKEHLKIFLQEKGYDVMDNGAFEFEKSDDYPDFCSEAGRNVAKNEGSFGFVFGKSGTGEMVVANKIRGVRCALAVNNQNVQLAREHNNCNMLSFGSDFVDQNSLEEMAILFMETEFSNEERHLRRVMKIKEIENSV